MSATGALRGLTVGHAVVVEAHPIRRPVALQGVAALIVRPDTYVAWASITPPTHEAVVAEIARIMCTDEPALAL